MEFKFLLKVSSSEVIVRKGVAELSSERTSISGYEGSLEPRESITVNINGAVARLVTALPGLCPEN